MKFPSSLLAVIACALGFGTGSAFVLNASGAAAPAVQSLAGEWRFAIDKESADLFKTDIATDRIALPGTTQTARKGAVVQISTQESKSWMPTHASPDVAWYQRDIEIPADWAGKRITLLLERTKITRVWVGERDMGGQDGIVTGQVHDLTAALTPGKHRLTVLVKRGPLPRLIGGWHLGGLQENWNGIIGRMELRATDPVWIERINIRPDIAGKRAKLLVYLGNTTGRPVNGELSLAAESWNAGAQATPHRPATITHRFTAQTGGDEAPITLDYELGSGAQLWNEFSPVLYKLTASLKTTGTARPYDDAYTTDFGLVELRSKGTVFTVNGTPTLLRGTHDGASFPLTGHPPMDLDSWLQILRVLKSYGVNHVRYHTWTPPQAAFAAADRLGLYLQPELPMFSDFKPGENQVATAYAVEQGKRTLRSWGNHPSFVMFALGNELPITPTNRPFATEMVNALRAVDPSKLYAEGSNNTHHQPTLNPNDDYWTTMAIYTPDKRYVEIRGYFSEGTGWIANSPPSTLRDYTSVLKLSPNVPLISHEIGQYTIFPNLDERKRYTGVIRAWKFDRTEERMRQNHVDGQDADFQRASGALVVACYKAEIEAYLATPGFGGFQLLDLVDFQGGGPSLVGVLNGFRESKGLITPEQWREFCSEVVPLARFAKYVWTSDETFSAAAIVAQYGPAKLAAARPQWTLTDEAGTVVARGRLPSADLEPGGVRALGKIETSLASVKAPARLTLELSLEGTSYRNRWPLWVYPKQPAAPAAPATVEVVRTLDAAQTALAAGRRVVFLPDAKDIKTASVPTRFTPVFWSTPLFPDQPPTMGLLCDPKHPALAQFPTESHTNWQWFNLLRGARALVLSPGELPDDYRPLIQVIDDLHTSRKLALAWEVRVGPGSLLVCTANLPTQGEKPEARQLMTSLLTYAASDGFRPGATLTPEKLQAILTKQLKDAKSTKQ